MSLLSAPGTLPPSQAGQYVAALLDLLGTQNPLDVLSHTPAALRNAVERLSPAQLGRPEAPGKWSTRLVLQHLADYELITAFRVRTILAHERPVFPPFDQDLWATRLDYEAADVEEALQQFDLLRRGTLRLWSRASATDLARVGVDSERGEESLERMRRLGAGHDLAHLHQLSRIRILLTGH